MNVDEIVQEESAVKKREMKDVLRDTKDSKKPAQMRRSKDTGCQLVLAQ